jgi:hypothetical protein
MPWLAGLAVWPDPYLHWLYAFERTCRSHALVPAGREVG